jgi:predicted DCC family thiol-disulfide oxidoreductase YuxK
MAPLPERIFYDGDCALCHGAVTFLVRRDRRGDLFRFAPLGGDAFHAELSPAEQASLPDSLVLRGADGRLLLRSDAVLHAFARLGQPWRAFAALSRIVPRPLRDAVYDLVARLRRRFLAPPAGTCPILPPDLRRRFDA